jgi:hypothetical protein
MAAPVSAFRGWRDGAWAQIRRRSSFHGQEITMKSLTTMLAARATMQAPADGLKVWRDVAATRVHEPIVDACVFSRPSNYAAQKVASKFGVLGNMAMRKAQEVRAGGLPQHFILVVTANDVIALQHQSGGGADPSSVGTEVARWQRSTLQVTYKPGGYLFNVVIAANGDNEEVECCVGNSPLSESFIGLLTDPARDSAATS